MKAKKLAKELLRTPNADVMLSIDVSTSEKDYDRRAFSKYIEGTQINLRGGHINDNDESKALHISVIGVGYLNK